MAKIFSSRNVMLAVAAILVIALVSACVVVSIKPKAEYKGVLDASEVTKTEGVIYSLEAENEFKRNMSAFLENLIASFFDTIEDFKGTQIEINNSASISVPIMNMFSKAGIPSNKLINFSEYLKNLDTDEAIMSFWLYIIRADEQPDGTYKARFATPVELAEIFMGKVDLSYAVNDIVDNTALTAEEVGRLLYELIYTFADAEQRDVLSGVGRASFVSLFVSATTIYEAYVEFSLVGGSLQEARILGELAYEMGAELDGLIENHGVQTLLTALWLNADRAIDDTELKEFLASAGVDSSTLVDVDQVNTALRAGINVAEFGIYFARTALMEVGNAPFEYLATYLAGEKDNAEDYLYMYQITLARAITSGIDDALDKGNLIKNKEKLIESLANFKLTVEETAVDVPDTTARLEEIEAYFAEYFDVLYSLSNEYASVENIEDLAGLGEQDFNKLKEYSNALNEFNYQDMTVGMDSLSSTLMVNITYNILSQIMNEALQGAVN